MARANLTSKPINPHADRDALPFFSKGGRGKPSNWWSVTQTGDYAADFATGRKYARAFLPMMTKNVGPIALGWIIDAMAAAGGSVKPYRTIDNVALGFINEIGDSLSSSIVALAVARMAVDAPNESLATVFRERFDEGKILQGRAA